MKIILLIMLVLMIKMILNVVVGLFKNNDKKKTDLKSQWEKLLNQSAEYKDLENSITCILFLIIGIYLTIFYLLAAFYVKQFIFVVLSVLLLLSHWKDIGKAIKWIATQNDDLLKENWKNKIGKIVWLGYIGYLIYYLIITW